MTTFVSALKIEPADTRAPIVAVAVRLAQAVDEGKAAHLPGLAKELRTCLSWLGEMSAVGDQVDELRARRAQRRVQQLLGDIPGGA